jgi:uncharacterized Rossmann fold enzyme
LEVSRMVTDPFSLAEALSASRVVMAGMDLGVYVGRYSKPHLKRATRANRTKRA